MVTAFELAGFFSAHAIWSICDGETLCPIFAYTTLEGERRMERLVINDDLEASVAYGKEKLESNEMDANDAVLLFDGRITLGGEKIDAIVVEIRAYFSPTSRSVIAIPYTPATAGKFLVHKPKVLQWKNCEDFEMNAALEAFFNGVARHTAAAKVWNDALDESK
jgi:hypothetical protein